MKQNKKEVTIDDVYEVVTFIKDNAVTSSEFNGLKSEFNGLKNEVGLINAVMVTKDYLDDKLADLGAEIGARINRRLEREIAFKKELIDSLKRHSVIDQGEIERLEQLV